jgi:peptidoglycan/xylan/chitin deacetylase (PgdA/CDA1 family)
MAALFASSAVVTAAVARPHPTPLAVSIASDTTTLVPPHSTAVLSAPTPRPPAAIPATTVDTGPCLHVPILLYHYIRINPNPADHLGWQLSVTPAEFRAEMDWLHQAGGHTVTLAQVMSALHGGPALPSHPVVLTFDDGHDDFATFAAPILAANGFVGTNFVVSGFLGRPSYMTAQQVQTVAAMGMVVGAHTVHHVDLMALTPQLAQIEIKSSKETLQQLIGRPVLDFAYPYGDVNGWVAVLVEQAGFREAVTTNDGTEQCLNQSYLLRRTRVGGGDTVWSFSHKAGVAAPPANWTDTQPTSSTTQQPAPAR